MTDDIVWRLRHVAWLAEEGSEVVDIAGAAADEIERLRIAGDKLAAWVEHHESCASMDTNKRGLLCNCGLDRVAKAWQEARRG